MKHIILTNRDNEIIDFLTKYKCATTSTISDIFFNGSKRPCTRRLKHLREHHFINSSQEYVALEQVHYIGTKPTQLKHTCLVASIVSKLYSPEIEIIRAIPEYKIGNVRADLLLVLKVNGNNRIYMVEACNTKNFDLGKYHKLYTQGAWKGVLPIFPTILVVSDKEIKTSNTMNIIQFNTRLDNFKLG